jgi:hypothetical protein
MEEQAKLRSAFKTACMALFVITFIMEILVPMPILFHTKSSGGIFTTLQIISFAWVFCNGFISPISSTIETAGFSKGLVMEVDSDLGTYVKQLVSLTSYEEYWDIRRSVQQWLIKNEQSFSQPTKLLWSRYANNMIVLCHYI